MSLQLKRKKYYNIIPVQFELIKCMRDREVVFMNTEDPTKVIRGLRVRHIDYLREIMLGYAIFSKPENIYISVAKYDYLPTFNHSLKERSKETSIFFKEEAINHINDYDLFLDFDCKKIKNFLEMKKEVYQILHSFDKTKVCYGILPSSTGFHIIVESQNLPFKNHFDKTDKKSKNLIIKEVTKQIKQRFNFKYLDMIGIGSLTKVRKCPYSLVGDNVVLPIENFSLFNYNAMDSNIVRQSVNLKNRGLKLHNDNGDEENRKHFRAFMYRYFIEV